MASRPLTPGGDLGQLVAAFIKQIPEEREQVASELEALLSIYGDGVIRPWSDLKASTGAIRYEIVTTLASPFEDVPVSVLVSLPATYPSTSPPQLQLLSKYIGAFGVDVELFGSTLKTYISSTGIEFNTDEVAVFDGIENVRERCTKWYEGKLNMNEINKALRGEGDPNREPFPITDEPSRLSKPEHVALPPGIDIVEAEPIFDRKSSFVGRACRIEDPAHVPLVLAYLLSDRRIARAAHPIINAWRCTSNGVLHQDNNDDDETAAGGRLAHLLQILEVDHVLVIVSRYFGGIHLGPDRFKHINQAARNALDLGGFLDSPEDGKKGKKGKRRA